MATGTGGIATKADCNSLAGKVIFSGDLTKCPTRAEIAATGGLVISGSYADNQCVMYSSLSQLPSLTIFPTSYTAVIGGGSFTLNITCNTTWQVVYPSWCSGTTSGSGNASITVTVGSNAGNPSRSGYITVSTTASPVVSKSCYVSQSGLPMYGGEVALAIQFFNRTPPTRTFSGRAEVTIGGVYVGSFDVNGSVPGYNEYSVHVGVGFFDFSSVNKTVTVSIKLIMTSGNMGNGGIAFSVSGNATGDMGIGSFGGSSGNGSFNLSFINSGLGSCHIYATCTIAG